MIRPGIRLGLTLVTAVVVGCVDPEGQRPGLRLSGESAREFPADWSFTNETREIAIEVHTPYLLPHSLTIWCGSAGGQLYLAARDPETKRWPGWVARNPNVRLRISGRIYETTLVRLDATQEIDRVRGAYAAKYGLPNPAPAGSPPMRYWRVDPRAL